MTKIAKKRKKKRHYFDEATIIKGKPPSKPLVLQTGLTVLNADTPIQTLFLWSSELDEKYMDYYGHGCLVWNQDHMHDLDAKANEALEHLIDVSRCKYDLDNELLAPFDQPTWRDAHA